MSVDHFCRHPDVVLVHPSDKGYVLFGDSADVEAAKGGQEILLLDLGLDFRPDAVHGWIVSPVDAGGDLGHGVLENHDCKYRLHYQVIGFH